MKRLLIAVCVGLVLQVGCSRVEEPITPKAANPTVELKPATRGAKGSSGESGSGRMAAP
jgi:hypothetical protein